MVAARPTGLKRRDARYARGREKETGFFSGRGRRPHRSGTKCPCGRQQNCHPVSPQGAFLVQLWCKQGGKDGNYGRNGQIAANSIERMDTVFPQIQDGQSSRTIRSQTLYPLSYGCMWGYYIAGWGTVKFSLGH